MKEIKYVMKVKEIGADSDWEEVVEEVVDDNIEILEHAKLLVKTFNIYRSSSQNERELVSLVSCSENMPSGSVVLQHDWCKVSLITEKGGYDKMRCKRCGATGKRYGLTVSSIKLDKGQKGLETCPV